MWSTTLKEAIALARLQRLLYALLRDHITFGTLEKLMAEHVDKVSDARVAKVSYSEETMAEYCETLASRILEGDR